MKQIGFACLIMLIGASLALADSVGLPDLLDSALPEYSLEDLYEIGISRSERVIIAEEDLFIAERNRDKSIAALLPRISVFGQYTHYSEEKTMASPTGSFTMQPESSSSWGLRLEQSFSLGGKEITAFRISKLGIESSSYDLSAVREEYILKIAESYYDVLKARKGVDIARANVQRLLKYRDEANIRLKIGEVTKTAVLRAEGELSGAQSDLIRAENVLNIAKVVLARVVGIQGDFEVSEPDAGYQSNRDAVNLDTVDLLKQTAFSERAEMKSLSIRKTIAEDKVTFARGGYWPYLSLEGFFLKRDESPSSYFFNDESLYGTIRIDFPLFEGGLRRAEVREAEASKRQMELAYDDLRKTISVEVEAAYRYLQTQAGILASLEDRLRFARDNYDAITRQFAFGLASSIDVIDANTLLVSAERQLAMAQYDYQLAILRLKRATGILSKTLNSKLPEADGRG